MEQTKMTGQHKQNIEINPAIAGIKYAIPTYLKTLGSYPRAVQ